MASNTDYWDPGERDVEGEEEAAILPSLIEDIQKVLGQYPDDGQILKEMVQNAEDAGATTVKVLADNRQFHQQFEPDVLEACPHLRYFKGPALCVYNEQEFDDDDWRSIRMLHKSVKEKNPLKVGRFGLGFKSVFHLTDRVVIISGSTLLYMDPSKGVARYCFKKRLANIKGKELHSILHCTEGPLFGISRATFERGHFRGTLFWFPLRIHPTDLSTSSVAYSERNLQDLLNSFKEEGGSMLLFLNNIEQIHGYMRKAGQDSQRQFSVTVADSCLKSVRSARKTFIERLPKCQGTLTKDAQYSQLTRLTAETVDHIAKTTDVQTWLIVNYYPGKGELSASQEGLCTNSELNYRPCVGIACPVGVPSTFQSLVFCTLPLPMDIRSATGLPVHVNGCFALSSNRRHLEWPDRRRGREFFENTVQWNLFLVEVLLPRAYSRLLESIVLEVRISAETFYSLWPDVSKVDDRWKVLAHQLYRGMAFKNVFFTYAKQGQWIALNQAVLRRFPPGVASHVAEAVVKVYRACDQNLVGLPEHVEDGLDQLDLLNHVKRVNARDVSGLVPYCLQKLRREDKLHVLEYLCAQGTVEDLADLQLLPLANLTFGVFTSSRSRSAQVIYWCDESMLSLFPDILSNFCDNKLPATLKQHLCRIAESVPPNTPTFDPASTSYTIRERIDSVSDIRCFADCNPRCDMQWLKDGRPLQTAGNVLELTTPDRSADGVYTCVATNVHGTRQKDLTIHVNYAPSITLFTINDQKTVATVREKYPVTINCRVASKPPSTVQIFNGSKLIRQIENTLQAKVAWKQADCLDTGTYSCTADNGVGALVSVTAELKVQCRPRLDPRIFKQPYVAAHLGKTAVIRVPVLADPTPSFLWYKIRDGVPSVILAGSNDTMGQSDKFFTVNGTTSTLTIENVQLTDFGDYVVSIANERGTNNYTFSLVPQSAPYVARNLTARPVGSDTAEVTWSPGFNGGDKQQFLLEYLKEGTNGWRTLQLDPGINDVTRSVSINVSDLNPSTPYTFRVRSRNMHGYSNYSNTARVLTDAAADSSVQLGEVNLTPVLLGVGLALGFLVGAGITAIVVVSRCRPKTRKNGENTIDDFRSDTTYDTLYLRDALWAQRHIKMRSNSTSNKSGGFDYLDGYDYKQPEDTVRGYNDYSAPFKSSGEMRTVL